MLKWDTYVFVGGGGSGGKVERLEVKIKGGIKRREREREKGEGRNVAQKAVENIN